LKGPSMSRHRVKMPRGTSPPPRPKQKDNAIAKNRLEGERKARGKREEGPSLHTKKKALQVNKKLAL